MAIPTDNAARKPRQAADVVTEVVGDEVLLYQPSSTGAVYMNATAAIVWSLCDGTHSVADIVATVAEHYPEAAGELAADIGEIVSRFEEVGLVVGS